MPGGVCDAGVFATCFSQAPTAAAAAGALTAVVICQAQLELGDGNLVVVNLLQVAVLGGVCDAVVFATGKACFRQVSTAAAAVALTALLGPGRSWVAANMLKLLQLAFC
jgi:positive regulator of sigma E activity